MAVVELAIHQVGRVSVNERVVRIAADDSYRVYTVIVHYMDAHNEPTELCLTLYGSHSVQGAVSVPFEFSKDEDDEPPPALKLEMERDLKGAVAMGKVWGEVFDNLFAPKR